MIVYAALGAVAISFGICFLAVPLYSRVAVRIGMMDVPARHKAHNKPVPLLGGCAIFAGIAVPSLLALALARVWSATSIPAWLPGQLASHVGGAAAKAPMALGVLGGALVLHVLGIVDDRRNLGAWTKLVVQVVICTAVVVFCNVRVLTLAGAPISVVLSVLWLVAITNAFNFLDNMDGLAVGVAVICAAALLGASAGAGQVFVSAWLCLVIGAGLGFLPCSLPPASSFMGDAGSLVIGYFLGILSVLTTYVRPDSPLGAYGLFVPLVVMAVPIYDMMSVIVLRVRERVNPMAGDRRHFSHRLLRRGMSVRKAVLTVYLCTAATAIGATLLPHVPSDAAAVLVLVQTVLVVLIIAMLESGDARASAK